eukprot:TRINITY_DN62594_c0_g2_i1.p1 TRINITY_DN62594_c0_g2~~TRINITY_DN62594_c0_g2_i1.p1  ORF type:complete len:318 (+),score=6.01 TRINITY_DN62594_c0_g2_i1:147-1100(+)
MEQREGFRQIPLDVVDVIDRFAECSSLSATCTLYWKELGGRWTAPTHVYGHPVELLISFCPHKHKLLRVSLCSGGEDTFIREYCCAVLATLASATPCIEHLNFPPQCMEGKENLPLFTDEQLSVGMQALTCLRSLSIEGDSYAEGEDGSYLVPSYSPFLEDLRFDVGNGLLGETRCDPLPPSLCDCCVSLSNLQRLHLGSREWRDTDFTTLFSGSEGQPALANSLRKLGLSFYNLNDHLLDWNFISIKIGQLTNLTSLTLETYYPVLETCNAVFCSGLPTWNLAKLTHFWWGILSSGGAEAPAMRERIRECCPLIEP